MSPQYTKIEELQYLEIMYFTFVDLNRVQEEKNVGPMQI